MTTKLKLYLGRKIIDSLRKQTSVTPFDLKPLIELRKVQSQRNIQMTISLSYLEKHFGISHTSDVLKIEPDEIIRNVHSTTERTNKKICFDIDRSIFLKEIIEQGTLPDIHNTQNKVVVEYSSPNVAKPFHMGHLRSTIIGNFIANLHTAMNNKVTRINYLGDWGTQFGLIKVGVEELKLTDEEIERNPLELLYKSYVHANRLAEKDELIVDRARKEFSKLENGSKNDIKNWKSYINYTIKELEYVYNRLGVTFDEYNYESMYSTKQINSILTQLENMKILKLLPNGKKVASVNDRDVTIVKSDGTGLYLTRDIAAAVDRFEKFQFDQMFYVIENGQNNHINSLRNILYQMDKPWAGRIKHVKFGRIHGMSTRKGNVVFLKDILDETRDLMIQRQLTSPTTKVQINNSDTSDVLGISCVIVNDLKQRRQKDYTFSWDRALQVQGDGGIKMQYTHCRLCNLQKYCGTVAATHCLPPLLEEPIIDELVIELARFHDVLYHSEQQLESCILVSYLFQLCNCISRALKVLRIKDQDPELGGQRLLLFNTSREILRQGMIILGLKPLSEM